MPKNNSISSNSSPDNDFLEPIHVSDKWMWIFSLIIIGFVIATIVLINVVINRDEDMLPDKVDIVVAVRPDHHNRNLLVNQVKSISKRMKFRRNIYILSPTANDGSAFGDTGVKNSYYVSFKPTTMDDSDDFDQKLLNEMYLQMPLINKRKGQVPDIADHAIFMADMTFPMREIKKKYLFYGERPRMFNIFRDEAEVKYLSKEMYLNYTVPTVVSDIALLKKVKKNAIDRDRDYVSELTNFILFEITEKRATIMNTMNKDLIINGDQHMANNRVKQFKNTKDHLPYFVTFHISGDHNTTVKEINDFLKDVY